MSNAVLPSFMDKKKEREHFFKPDFEYTHSNPYHHKLKEEFATFSFCDKEAEVFRGKWQTDVFQNTLPLYVEIGCGFGHFMEAFCADHPEINYVGIDYRFKRSYELAKKIARQENPPRLLRARAERLNFIFAPQEIATIFYFFPDPWPKRRHHKKRLVSVHFWTQVETLLSTEGLFYFKTDNPEYYRWFLHHFHHYQQECPTSSLKLQEISENLYQEKNIPLLTKYQTKFEKIFLRQKKPIYGALLKKCLGKV